MANFDFDFIVIGSGFGGSVSALRLSEKGYSVCILEQGKRFRAQDFAKSNLDIRRYLWAPKFKCFGIQNLTLFKNVLILSGCGVGGGSLVYANTLMMPSDEFFLSPFWSHLGDWKNALAPHYLTAKKMLGAQVNPNMTFVDDLLKECASDLGRPEAFAPTEVAIFFGEPGKEVADPYFNGAGPVRSGCTLCGGCMVGCRYNAKNTLDKNYLYLAEKRGARIFAETRVTRIVPIGGAAGREGYEIHVETSTAWFQKNRRIIRAKNVVSSAGVLGTVELLLKSKFIDKTLPDLSPQLGRNVRTNSEVFEGVTEFNARKNGRDYSRGIAIGSIFKPDANTSIEPVRYPKGSDFMKLLAVPLVDEPRTWLRPFRFFAQLFMHPLELFRLIFNFRWAETSAIFLVMQNLDNRIQLSLGRGIFNGFRKGMVSGLEPGAETAPSEIPAGNALARLFAKKVGGVPQCAVSQVTVNIPTTAHILGGCGIGANAEEGVIDTQHKIFGYEGFYVCDGSVMPANLGVNPSLTITAMSERAMSFVKPKETLTFTP